MTRPMTVTEKILAAHTPAGQVEAGQLIRAGVDLVLANDITAPLAIDAFEAMGASRVFDPRRVALVLSHFTPARDIQSAELCRRTRDFARRQGIDNLIQEGQGIEHVVLPERGMVLPGDLVLGADSHTCTYGALGCFATGVGSTDLAYAMATGETWLRVPESLHITYRGKLRPWVTGKDLILFTIGHIGEDGADYMAIEFTGEAVDRLGMHARFTMANMAIEAGAKNGVLAADHRVVTYLRGRTRRDYRIYRADPDAVYARRLEFDVADIELQVAFPFSPGNVRPIGEAGEIRIDQVFIGSCTNGRIEDLRSAAAVLAGRRVHPGIRLLVIPGSAAVYRQALAEGLVEVFVEAGGMVGIPTCGPCLGGHTGVLGRGERCVATSNRNFVGRMGHPEAEVYLAGPAIAAASAVAGRICSPQDLGIAFKEEVEPA